MSGICTKHTKSHKPSCTQCTALPYDSHYEEGMETIEVNFTPQMESFLFNEIVRLNCRPSDYFAYVINNALDNLEEKENADE